MKAWNLSGVLVCSLISFHREKHDLVWFLQKAALVWKFIWQPQLYLVISNQIINKKTQDDKRCLTFPVDLNKQEVTKRICHLYPTEEKVKGFKLC